MQTYTQRPSLHANDEQTNTVKHRNATVTQDARQNITARKFLGSIVKRTDGAYVIFSHDKHLDNRRELSSYRVSGMRLNDGMK